jgi:hypothetical protein
MTSGRDNNKRENIGTMPFGKKGLTHFIQKKAHRLRVGRESIIVKKDGGPHLLKNGHRRGFTNYGAFPQPDESRAILIDEAESSGSSAAMRQSEGTRASPVEEHGPQLPRAFAARKALKKDRRSGGKELEEMGGAAAVAAAGLESIKDAEDDRADELRRALVHEALLHQLPSTFASSVGRSSPTASRSVSPSNAMKRAWRASKRTSKSSRRLPMPTRSLSTTSSLRSNIAERVGKF